MARSSVRERGAASVETAGAIAVAALLVVSIVAFVPGSQLGQILTDAVCSVRTGAACVSASGVNFAPPGASAPVLPTTSVPPATGDTGDRRDQEGDTRDSRRGRGEDKAPDDPTVPGPVASSDSLGTAVVGTSVAEPVTPAWKPADGGAGEYDSQTAWPWDHAKKVLVEAAANVMSGKWPDAARNLSHYLANTGEPLEQDVNRVLHDVPLFQAKVDETKTSLGEDAVNRARASGATGPVTFPISTAWTGYYIHQSESANWFYAMGGVSYSLTGQVTVYPPTSPGGSYRYEVTTRVNLADQYNWDGGKSTEIGPITVTDDELARLHRQGLAREYRNEGRSDPSTSKGEVP